ncbi:MAG: hypothetical protein ACE361_26405 [Aureliella sp.]
MHLLRCGTAVSILGCLLLVSVADIAGAQEEPPGNSYSVTLSEYRLKELDSTKISESSIVQLIATSKAKPIETISLTTFAGSESVVQFGRTVSVTVGFSQRGAASQRVTQDRQIGSLLQITVNPNDEWAAVELSYEASRHEGEGTDDSPPELTNTRIQTSQMLKWNQPTLIGGTSAGETSYVFLTVTKR